MYIIIIHPYKLCRTYIHVCMYAVYILSGPTVYRSQLQYIQQLAQKRLATSHLHGCPPVPSPHPALVAKSPGKLQGQCNGALNKPRHDQCISATIQAVVPALGREESPSFAPGEDANFAECAGSANRLEQRETFNTCASAVIFLLHVTFCDVGFCP